MGTLAAAESRQLMAGEREVRIKFTGDSAVLKGSAADVRQIFQNLIADENDARGAGEKLADAQKQVAERMRTDMAEISAAADLLADSLGPEMVQAIEATGRSIEDEVQRFQKLGLTLTDIKRDSDLLANGMKDLDDAARMGSGSIGDGFKKVSREVDQSRSVMANFAGNAIQELPLVGQAFGPLSMALSQFAEYAAEGNVKLSGLVKAAAGLGAGLAAFAVIDAVADSFQNLGSAQREAADRAEKFREAADQATGGIDLQTLALASNAEAWALYNDAIYAGADKATRDLVAGNKELTDTLIDLGIGMDEVVAAGRSMSAWQEFQNHVSDLAVEKGLAYRYDSGQRVMANNDQGKSLFELTDQLYKTALAADSTLEANVALARTGDLLAISYLKATNNFGQLTTAEQAAAQAALDKASADERATAAAGAAVLATEDQAAAAAEAEAAIRSLADAQLASIDANFAAIDAADNYTTSLEKLAVAVDDPKTGVDELRQAQDDAAQAAIGLALANQTSAENLSALAGAPLTAAESHQVLIKSLYDTAVALAPDSPLRAQLIEYIGTLQFVPGQVTTTVTANTDDAATRIGGVKAAIDDLDGSSTTTDSEANTETALDRVTTLATEVDKLNGTTIVLKAVLEGDADTIARLHVLQTEMQRTIDKANEADRAVARVAG
ncbi:MAG: hypothetical protein ABMA25_09645 [Ilumatobacteraceae bacterium]